MTAAAGLETLSHNLLGQRLGRKGRDTRERILAAAERLLADVDGPPFTLSAVAREASLAMTSLYLYFADLTELLLALLEPAGARAEVAYLADLRTRWPDEGLDGCALAFVQAFHGFWRRHTRVLHLRDSPPLPHDDRLVQRRIAAASPLIELLRLQMDDSGGGDTLASGLATALVTGLERLVAVVTDAGRPDSASASQERVGTLLEAQACILALTVRHGRALSGAAAPAV